MKASVGLPLRLALLIEARVSAERINAFRRIPRPAAHLPVHSQVPFLRPFGLPLSACFFSRRLHSPRVGQQLPFAHEILSGVTHAN